MQTRFIFRCRPLTGDALLPQVSRALEQRAALLSQEEWPRVRQMMEQMSITANKRAGAIRRGRLLGALALAAGLILTVVGLEKKPVHMALLEMAGMLVMVLGAWGCVRYRKAPETAFDLAARKLLATRALIGDDQVRVVFEPDNMIIELNHKGEKVGYSSVQLAIETQDTWLLTFGERAMVLLKADLTGDEKAFSCFLEERVHCVQILECP